MQNFRFNAEPTTPNLELFEVGGVLVSNYRCLLHSKNMETTGNLKTANVANIALKSNSSPFHFKKNTLHSLPAQLE